MQMQQIYPFQDTYTSRTNSKKSRLAVLILLLSTLALCSGCEKEKAVGAGPAEVEVFDVIQKDVPIAREWVSTLSGFVNETSGRKYPVRHAGRQRDCDFHYSGAVLHDRAARRC